MKLQTRRTPATELLLIVTATAFVVMGCERRMDDKPASPSKEEGAMDVDNEELVGLEIREVGDATVVRFKGDKTLNGKNVQTVRDQLLRLVEQKGRKRFVLDFSNVEFISEEAFGMLITLNRGVRETHGRLRLCSLIPEIHETFVILHFDKVFDIQKNVEEALERPDDSAADNNRRLAWERAIFRQAKGEHDKAIADYSELVRLDPKDAATYMARGSAWSAKGDRDKAIADYTTAIQLAPDHSLAYSWRGILYHGKGQFDQAIADHTKVIQLNPDVVGGYFERAKAYAAKGEPERAITDYTEAIRLAPGYETYLRCGIACWEMGEYDPALGYFNEAIRLNPEYAGSYYERGLVHLARGSYDEAIQDFTKRLEFGHGNLCAFCYRGFAYDENGDSTAAARDYDKVIRLAERHLSDHKSIGARWGQQRRWADAIREYTIAIHLTPSDTASYFGRGRAYSGMGEYEKSIGDYAEVVRLDPNGAGAHNGLAWLLATCPDPKYRDGKKATEHARKACKLTERKEWDYIDTLAAAYAEAGDFDKAVEWQEKTVEMAPQEMKSDLRSRLDLYRSDTPYREDPTK